MSVTEHPGFNLALADSCLTASECEAICEAVRSAERALPGSVRSEPASDPVPYTSPPEREPCSMRPDRSGCSRSSSEFHRAPVSPFGNSSFDPSHLNMTAGEILDLERRGVQP